MFFLVKYSLSVVPFSLGCFFGLAVFYLTVKIKNGRIPTEKLFVMLR